MTISEISTAELSTILAIIEGDNGDYCGFCRWGQGGFEEFDSNAGSIKAEIAKRQK